jgi:aminopeptidase YwaD
MMFRVIAVLVCGLGVAGLKPSATEQADLKPSATDTIPATAERAYQAIDRRFDERGAMEVVTFMQQFWRIAGNPGFNATIDHIKEGLITAGFAPARVAARASVLVEEFQNSGRGWDYTIGTLAFDGVDEPPLLSRDRDRVSLAINSFATPVGGLRAPLVDVGLAREADFAGKDLKGAVVLGDAPLSSLWQQAVRRRGAAGVISTEIARYIRPSNGAAMSDEQRDVLQWGSVPYDADAKAFGFKSSWRAAERMRARLRQGSVTVRVEIASMFYDGPVRTLIAEIPGRSVTNERIVMVAHVQEPGANDNASGCATLYAMARAIVESIRTGALPQPERTLTFMWVDEVRGSRQWIAAHPDAAHGVQYMFAMDMTGEDTERTGGTFLIEREADPAAVWPRPSDPHTQWGAGDVKAESLKGSLLNDLHYAICLRRARDTGWVVRTNPYEGGSDHTAFRGAGVPSILDWHFTDRFYHTNQDTTEKVSASEVRNVGVSVAATAWLLASAAERDALAVVDLLESAADRRFSIERAQGADRAILDAWTKWYREAFESVLRLPPAGPTEALKRRVAAAGNPAASMPK